MPGDCVGKVDVLSSDSSDIFCGVIVVIELSVTGIDVDVDSGIAEVFGALKFSLPAVRIPKGQLCITDSP